MNFFDHAYYIIILSITFIVSFIIIVWILITLTTWIWISISIQYIDSLLIDRIWFLFFLFFEVFFQIWFICLF